MKTLLQFEIHEMDRCLDEDPNLTRGDYRESYPVYSRRDQWIRVELMPWVEAGNVLPWPVIHFLRQEKNLAFLIHLSKHWPHAVPVREGVLVPTANELSENGGV